MASLAEIYEWFMTGKKPTQAQFWASWGSFWHKEEKIPQSAISNLTNVLNAKAEKTQFDAHKTDEKAHAALFDAKADLVGGKVPLEQLPAFKSKEVLCERFAPSGQVCTLPSGAIAINAMLDGYPHYLEQSVFESDLNTFTQTGDIVTFKMILDPNSQILIITINFGEVHPFVVFAERVDRVLL
jgi:hypothetical protein